MENCYHCGSLKTEQITICGGKCGRFLCKECLDDEEVYIFTWLPTGQDIYDMVSEDEILQNEDLVAEVLDEGDFFCPRCCKTRT